MWLKILKVIIGIAIVILLVYFTTITMLITKYQITGLLPLILVILGFALALIDVLSNIAKSSPIKVGGINRAEFYGVMTVVIGSGISMYLSTQSRIDQIMLILMQR